jgi:tyrosine-specific transport protein
MDENFYGGLDSSQVQESLSENSEKDEGSLFSELVSKVGYIDENRYRSFPEYSSGEVPRLWSNVDYSESETVLHASGSVVGATALVAGTTIGAGILAIPTATAAVGFVPSTIALFIAYAYMTMSGLLIAELTINRLGRTGQAAGTGLLDLYRDALPAPWNQLGSAAYFFLHYAVRFVMGSHVLHESRVVGS